MRSGFPLSPASLTAAAARSGEDARELERRTGRACGAQDVGRRPVERRARETRGQPEGFACRPPHVKQEIVLGGAELPAGFDDPVLQPGLLDPGAKDIGVRRAAVPEPDLDMLDEPVEGRDRRLQGGQRFGGQRRPRISPLDPGGDDEPDALELEGGDILAETADLGPARPACPGYSKRCSTPRLNSVCRPSLARNVQGMDSVARESEGSGRASAWSRRAAAAFISSRAARTSGWRDEGVLERLIQVSADSWAERPAARTSRERTNAAGPHRFLRTS